MEKYRWRAFLFLLLPVLFQWTAMAKPPTAKTALGNLIGRVQNGVTTWLGVPYARAQRWRPPVDWQDPYTNGTREALEYGAACPQLPNVEAPTIQNENCLVVNIYAPFAIRKPLPVMIFIHGGGFTEGSIAPMYNGSFEYSATELVVSGNVVVITLQYRLGVLGWLPIWSTNLGLRDQQSALRWVRRHAKAFGGDVSHTTLFGQSAGGMSTCAHLTAPASRGLFDRAIIESGFCERLGKSDGITTTLTKLAFKLASGCLTLECLDRLEVSKVLAAQGSITSTPLTVGPTVDGDVLPAQPLELISSGQWAQVPVILGTVSNEAFWGVIYDGAGSLWPSSKPMSPLMYRVMLTALAAARGVNIAALLKAYPAGGAGENLNRFAAAVTDGLWLCPARRLANSLAASGLATFMYHWDWRSLCPAWVDKFFPSAWNVSHSSELPFIFDYIHNCTPSTHDLAIKAAVHQFWSSFSHNSSPGCVGSTCWKAYTPANEVALRFGHYVDGVPDLSSEVPWHGHPCGVWDAAALEHESSVGLGVIV